MRGTNLKFSTVIIRDSEGERRLKREDLPLRLGTGSDCDIRLPGPGSAAFAILDELDGEPFVQPVGRGASLKINDAELRASRKLADGDMLEFFGTKITIRGEEDSILLHVRLEDSAYVTKPPEMPGTDGQAGSETIAPTAFKRARETAVAEVSESRERWKIAVGAAILILAVVSFLLFTSKSIQFDVQPAGADSLSVEGGWFKLPLADRMLLRQGRYTVNVEKEGYYDVAQDFEVGPEPSRTIQVEMRRLPGQLMVWTEPAADAVVTVDDDKVGQAPYGPLELQPGTHSVSVSAERFLPYVHRLQVPGLGKLQELEVQLVPQWANVEVSSEPPGATVYQGTMPVGQTPMTLELLEGNHSLSMMLDGYKAWDGTVETVANEDSVLPTVRLEPANARLLVNSIPRGANVTVNGRYRGQTPVPIPLSPDVDYQIGLSKAGYGTTTRQIRLPAAASREITVDLTARVGEVTVDVLPGDATVYVNGQARGTGTVTLSLPSSPHRLEVKRDGYQTFSRSITPRPGYPQKIPVRLVSEAELAAQTVAMTIENPQGMVLRRVEPGEFAMGTSRAEQGRRANEVIVPVVITRPYFIGTKEVTNREFRRFRENHDSRGDLHASLAGDLNPVVNVTWEDAVEYCNWLSTQEGLPLAYKKVFERWQPVEPMADGYRLPTEAEWVWAMRYQGRPTALTFPWGDRMPPRRDSGNYADKAARELVPTVIPGYDDGYASTAPVGTFPANALGIYDAGGNVAEWMQDYYAVPTPGQTEPVKDPHGPPRGANRVIRGSSWMHAGILELRMGYRDFGNRGRPDVGFRVVKNVP